MQNPALARKVRRVARARRDGFYTTIEDALAEVQGWRSGETSNALDHAVPAPEPDARATAIPGSSYAIGQGEHSYVPVPATPQPEDQVPPDVQDAVLQLLECADRLSSTMSILRPYRDGAALSDPWGTWSSDALEFIKQEVTGET